MRYNERTIMELVGNGDHKSVIRLVSTLRQRVNKKGRLLSRQADIAANLRHAFMETEVDRDRLQRMCGELYDLCRKAGREQDAAEIAERYGGIDQPGPRGILI